MNCPLEKQGQRQIKVTWPRTLRKHGLRGTWPQVLVLSYQGHTAWGTASLKVFCPEQNLFLPLVGAHRLVGGWETKASLSVPPWNHRPVKSPLPPGTAVSSTLRSFLGLISEHTAPPATGNVPAGCLERQKNTCSEKPRAGDESAPWHFQGSPATSGDTSRYLVHKLSKLYLKISAFFSPTSFTGEFFHSFTVLVQII